MSDQRRLPVREKVFLVSLLRHGFKFKRSKANLKLRHGYIIPATKREDAQGIDFWVKLPKREELIPVQVTQRGTRLHQKYRNPPPEKHADFVTRSETRLRQKRLRCRLNGIAFVLVRDYEGNSLSTVVAWGDKKALLFGVQNWQPA